MFRLLFDPRTGSSEAHFQSSKTCRGSYLETELYIFVKIFEFYLVTKSLSGRRCDRLQRAEWGPLRFIGFADTLK
jgi:hypothetical protein